MHVAIVVMAMAGLGCIGAMIASAQEESAVKGFLLGMLLPGVGLGLVVLMRHAHRRPRSTRQLSERTRMLDAMNANAASNGSRPRSVPSNPLTASPRWVPDPTRRHQLRMHDGTAFTDQVMDGGVPGTDRYP